MTTIRNPDFDAASIELKVIGRTGDLLPLNTPIRWSVRAAAERDFDRIRNGETPVENVPEFITVNDTP
jgi:hypothetical protein